MKRWVILHKSVMIKVTSTNLPDILTIHSRSSCIVYHICRIFWRPTQDVPQFQSFPTTLVESHWQVEARLFKDQNARLRTTTASAFTLWKHCGKMCISSVEKHEMPGFYLKTSTNVYFHWKFFIVPNTWKHLQMFSFIVPNPRKSIWSWHDKILEHFNTVAVWGSLPRTKVQFF